MLVFGWGGGRIQDHGPALPMSCSNCNNETVLHAVTMRKFFSLFWIPLIPYSRKDMLMCSVCTRGLELRPNEGNAAAQLAKMYALFRAGQISSDQFGLSVQVFSDLMQMTRGTWQPDPHKLHEDRLWNGVEWTNKVRNDGEVSISELPALPPPPSP